MSCSVGLVPTLICVIIGLAQEGEMTVGRFFGLLIAMPAVGFLLYLLICIIRGTIAIILAIIVFIVCAILIITSITGSDECKAYGETQDKIREYERAIKRHRQDCYDDLMSKYEGILPYKEMESSIPVYEIAAASEIMQNPRKYI